MSENKINNSNITKEMLLKQKLNNFMNFISEKIGKENKLYKYFDVYVSDTEEFVKVMGQIKHVRVKDEIPKEKILSFLSDFDVKCVDEDITKINRYLNCFIDIIFS